MLNIVVPLAGKGSRFVDAGHEDPKPFIDVAGIPMILRVIENLMPYEAHRFIFIARREHELYIKKHMSFATDVIYIDEVTEGAACTVLLAEKFINNNDPLIIANSDQLVEWNQGASVQTYCDDAYGTQITWKESNNIQDMINTCETQGYEGMIATFNANHPKWSYARTSGGRVVEVAEKKVISNHATVGIYFYRLGKFFVQAAKRMIKKNIRVNGEFYVCPVFNEMIDMRWTVGIYLVSHMVGLGTPEDLRRYLDE